MTKGIAAKVLMLAALLAVLFAGCESDGGLTEDPSFTAEKIELVTDAPVDRKIGSDLIKYMFRNCPGPESEIPPMKEKWGPKMREYMTRSFEGWRDMCASIRTIEVEDSRITATSALSGNDLEDESEAFCNLVQGSDVADFTPGHELLNSSGESLIICGEKNAYR